MVIDTGAVTPGEPRDVLDLGSLVSLSAKTFGGGASMICGGLRLSSRLRGTRVGGLTRKLKLLGGAAASGSALPRCPADAYGRKRTKPNSR